MDLAAWDERHRGAAGQPAAEPASFVAELMPLLPSGPALDLACGTGRNALLLAARQRPVTAVDGSAVALDILEARARAAGQTIRRGHSLAAIAGCGSGGGSGIDLVQGDLEKLRLP